MVGLYVQNWYGGTRDFQGALPGQGRKPSSGEQTSFGLEAWGPIDLGGLSSNHTVEPWPSLEAN